MFPSSSYDSSGRYAQRAATRGSSSLLRACFPRARWLARPFAPLATPHRLGDADALLNDLYGDCGRWVAQVAPLVDPLSALFRHHSCLR